jgi:hypothetical protein
LLNEEDQALLQTVRERLQNPQPVAVKESLSDKLARFDNERHGGEVMATTLPIKASR